MDSRWVIYGAMGGINIKESNLLPLLSKRASIITTTLRNRSDKYKTELIQSMARDCIPGFESGVLKPIIDKEFNLSEAAEGLEYLRQNLNIGKVVFRNDL